MAGQADVAPHDAAAGLPPGGTVLGVWAHPDDEAFLAAGTLAGAAAQGCRVVSVYATRGERGTAWVPGALPADLGAVRSGELTAALATIGAGDVRWLDHPDGGLAQVPAVEAVAQVLAVLDEVDPDVVLTFGPDGFTGHPDHVAVGTWVTIALLRRAAAHTLLWQAAVTDTWITRFAPALATFDAFWPGHPVAAPEHDVAWGRQLDTPLLDRKVAALRAHRSQTAHLFAAFGEPFMRAMAATEWWSRPREPTTANAAAVFATSASRRFTGWPSSTATSTVKPVPDDLGMAATGAEHRTPSGARGQVIEAS